MSSTTVQQTTRAIDLWDSGATVDGDCADLRRLLEGANRSSLELRQCAERALRENDQELARFFERCAASDLIRTAEAKRLLHSRARHPESEIPTSAAFAAGDGADDADVSPDSRRGKVGVWPAL